MEPAANIGLEHLRLDPMMKKYLGPNMVPTYTMGFRINMVDHMSLYKHGLSLFDLNLTSRGHSISKWLQTTEQRHRWFTLVTLNPMVLVEPWCWCTSL